MNSAIGRTNCFKQRLLEREFMIGSWVKTPSPIICEVLSMSELDVICLDSEHAPFDRLSLDSCLQVCRANDLPALVRTPSLSEHQILNALDCGAVGIQAPHVRTVSDAERLAKASRYGPGGRGYAGSSRSAGYGTRAMEQQFETSAKETAVIAQLEDAEALDVLDDLMQVSGVDCYFIGRIDLTVALGANSPTDTIVVEAVEKICQAGAKAGKAIGMFTPRLDEVSYWQDKGASLFLLKSDHALLADGATAMLSMLRK